MITPSNGFLDGEGNSPFGAHADHVHPGAKNQAVSTASDVASL